jgi:hypothetical protein
MTKKVNFNPFLNNLLEWVDQFSISNHPAMFSVKRSQENPSLYGICDILFNLTISNKLEEFFSKNPDEEKDLWIKKIQSYQNPKNGWFKDGIINFGMHFKEHSTAFAVSALKLLGATPEFSFKITEKLNTKQKVFSWLKHTPEWGLLYWPGSHRGGGVASIFATLGSRSYPHKDFFKWYFQWLDEKADPKVGFWRLGWIHRLFKNRLTINELGGAVHYYWIYEFFNHPIPYPEKVIDSTLLLQNELGTWDNHVSYCIDLDAIFCITRCLKQTKDYRINDILFSVKKYLNYLSKTINKKDFLFSHYTDTHKMTGLVCAIAEIYKAFPELIEGGNQWIQTLDETPWI